MALVLASSCWIGLAARASADEQIGVGQNPWVDVQLETGTLTVKTWDRPQVQVATDGQMDVRHVDAADTRPADSAAVHRLVANRFHRARQRNATRGIVRNAPARRTRRTTRSLRAVKATRRS